MKKMKNIISFKLALIILFCNSLYAQNEIEKVKSTVSKQEIKEQIYFLASDELKGRLTGTPENKIAAKYIADELKKYGVNPPPDSKDFYQKVNASEIYPPTKSELRMGSFKTNNLISVNYKNVDFRGELTFLQGDLNEKLNQRNIKGKLAFLRNNASNKEDVLEALSGTNKMAKLIEEHEGAGVLEIFNLDSILWKNFMRYLVKQKTVLKNDVDKGTNIPRVWVNDPEGEIFSVGEKGNLPIEIEIGGISSTDINTQNVIGFVEGTDPKLKDEYIVYTAHYDHLGVGKPINNDSIYNGARDNAVGVSAVLNIAKNIAKYPTKRSAMFIFFTGEEGNGGFLGSSWFVEYPVIPLGKMVFCFNIDNAGYNNTSLVTVVGLSKTNVKNKILNAASEFGLNTVGSPKGQEWLFEQSDNIKFADKGIPSLTFSMGFTALDDEVRKYYHQVTDNPDNLDYNYVYKFVNAYVLASRKIANDLNTPYWEAGSEYLEIGNKLYGK